MGLMSTSMNVSAARRDALQRVSAIRDRSRRGPDGYRVMKTCNSL